MNRRKIKEMLVRAAERTLNLKSDLEKTFKVRDSRDRKIFYPVLGLLLLVLAYLVFFRGYFIKQDEKKAAVEKAKIEQVRQERIEKVESAPKSRISFFLSRPIRANLAIPDYWEGNYRLSESGDKASFIYIEDPDNISEIFYVRMVPLSAIGDLEKGEAEISQAKRASADGIDYAFVFKMSEGDPYAGNEELKGKFDRMKIDAREMLERYFKVF